MSGMLLEGLMSLSVGQILKKPHFYLTMDIIFQQRLDKIGWKSN